MMRSGTGIGAARLSMLAIALVAAPARIHAQVSARPSTDTLLKAIATTAQDPSRITRNVWTSYEVPTQFVVCRPSGRTVVVGDTATLARFGVGDTDATRGMRLLPTPPGRLADICFDLAFTVGSARLVAVPVVGALYSIGDSLTANIVQLYHEAFHAFQARVFAPTRAGEFAPHQEVRLPLEIIRSPAFDSIARIERRLLAEALRTDQRDSTSALLTEYLALRDARMQLLPPKLRNAEAHNERKEGSAQWVGYTATFRRMRRSPTAVRDLIVLDLQRTPSFAAGRLNDYFGNSYRQWHIYATGAAIGVLLEKRGVRWRDAIQEGATFEELLRNHLRGGS